MSEIEKPEFFRYVGVAFIGDENLKDVATTIKQSIKYLEKEYSLKTWEKSEFTKGIMISFLLHMGLPIDSDLEAILKDENYNIKRGNKIYNLSELRQSLDELIPDWHGWSCLNYAVAPNAQIIRAQPKDAQDLRRRGYFLIHVCRLGWDKEPYECDLGANDYDSLVINVALNKTNFVKKKPTMLIVNGLPTPRRIGFVENLQQLLHDPTLNIIPSVLEKIFDTLEKLEVSKNDREYYIVAKTLIEYSNFKNHANYLNIICKHLNRNFLLTDILNLKSFVDAAKKSNPSLKVYTIWATEGIWKSEEDVQQSESDFFVNLKDCTPSQSIKIAGLLLEIIKNGETTGFFDAVKCTYNGKS